MQMTLRARILDLLPIAVATLVVSAFGTFIVLEYVIRDRVAEPPRTSMSTRDVPSDARDER